MCLFKYREKKYGKLTFILFSLVVIALAVASVYGGIYAVINMTHWAKYIIVVVASLVGLCLGFFGIFMFAISFSMINHSKSVRDVNSSKGVSGVNLCDKCGRPIDKKAEYCNHCGASQESNFEIQCPECKTKNPATAEFCSKCGAKFNK